MLACGVLRLATRAAHGEPNINLTHGLRSNCEQVPSRELATNLELRIRAVLFYDERSRPGLLDEEHLRLKSLTHRLLERLHEHET